MAHDAHIIIHHHNRVTIQFIAISQRVADARLALLRAEDLRRGRENRLQAVSLPKVRYAAEVGLGYATACASPGGGLPDHELLLQTIHAVCRGLDPPPVGLAVGAGELAGCAGGRPPVSSGGKAEGGYGMVKQSPAGHKEAPGAAIGAIRLNRPQALEAAARQPTFLGGGLGGRRLIPCVLAPFSHALALDPSPCRVLILGPLVLGAGPPPLVPGP